MLLVDCGNTGPYVLFSDNYSKINLPPDKKHDRFDVHGHKNDNYYRLTVVLRPCMLTDSGSFVDNSVQVTSSGASLESFPPVVVELMDGLRMLISSTCIPPVNTVAVILSS